jgi:enterochelin esterase-like enzyme/outer membrane protein assembly factor BamB
VAVAEGRAVTSFSDGKDDLVVAFDLHTGRELWRHEVAPTREGRDGSFDGPIATPALAPGRVFGLGPRGHLFALDGSSGRLLSKMDLGEREGVRAPHYGFSASPLFAGGVFVAEIGGEREGMVAGFDPATGERRWRRGDDTVSYQSPVAMVVGGRVHLVAVGDTQLLGLDPANGNLLWRHEHGGDDGLIGGLSLVPVPAGEGRLFLKNREDSSTMLRLSMGADGRTVVDTLWTAPVLRATYSVPVYHHGFLYGMSGRATLACVDAATGEVRWRSREPGDGFPMLVGDDLVVLTKEGTLHVAKASPEGWTEHARLELFRDLVWSPPSFAEGSIFARSQGEIARVDWRALHGRGSGPSPPGAASAAHVDAPSPRSARFARFLAEVAGARDKPLVVDRFLAENARLPLVEWPDRALFLYRGEATDVGIAGDLIGERREDPMRRVPGTDLFWYEAALEPDARVSYHFVRNFEEPLPDPRNPWRVPAPRRSEDAPASEQSSLAMPAWRAPEHLAQAAGSRRGRVEVQQVSSTSHPGARLPLHVYVPSGYDTSTDRWPVALVLDGDAAREDGLVARSLDHLIPDRVAPVLVAFVGRPDWGARPPSDEEHDAAFGELLVEDLIPFLDGRYRTDPRPEARAVVGAAFAGWLAAYTTFRHPRVFGGLGLQSVFLLDSEEDLLQRQVGRAAEHPLRLYLDWGRYDRRATREAWDIGMANQRFAAFLRTRGYRPAGGEVMDGPGWAGWRNRTDLLFEALFPAAAATAP